MSAVNDGAIGPIEPLWRAKEVSQYLNVSQATLSRWRRERVGPPFLQVRGVARYNPSSVRAWVCQQENGHG